MWNFLAMTKQGDQAFRVDSSKQKWSEMTYGGAVSFLRRQYSRDLSNVDIVISGLPYDAATTNRPGARFGPRAIREASTHPRRSYETQRTLRPSRH